ncbi:MAG: hypothetical protein QNJ22_06590 [Desulfosarcinaceae bacterium]|nr:hypothetical protein [Desulfosarcinaceae bacterium]
MIAYYVHDDKDGNDVILLPDMSCAVEVNKEKLEMFISPAPAFANWSGNSCVDANPEAFGTVVASREEGGDVCVIKREIWQARMEYYLKQD